MLSAVLATGPATAAGNSLTVTTLGRSGTRVTATASVVNLDTNTTYQLKSGRARTLPKGRYAVLVDIWNAKDSTNTLGAKVVKVSGKTKTTIDARKGRALKVSLDPAPGTDFDHQLQVRVCAAGGISGRVDAWGPRGKLFVIPDSSKDLRFAYLSSWRPYTGPAAAVVVAATTTGVPSTPGRVFRRASLATVNAYARRGPAGSPDADFTLQASGRSCQSDMHAGIYSGTTPFTVKAHVSPGTWELRSDNWADDHGQPAYIGHWSSIRSLAAGRTYSQIFYRSAWGPGVYLPEVVDRRLHFYTSGMFTDPGFGSGSRYGGEASQKSVSTLKLGGKVLAKKTNTDWRVDRADFTYTLKKAGWYTLSTTAKRYRPGITYPAGMLSTSSSVTFRFYADPKVSAVAPVFLTRFVPTGLDMNNRARPGGTTTVDLKLDRQRQGPDAKFTTVKAKTVTAKASFDGGRTWKAVTVKRSGSTWTAAVANPSSGSVSLRAKVTDAKGNSSEVTVYRAYTVG
jgi:hypothetical protein